MHVCKHASLATFSVARDVARCRDDEYISEVCVLKPENVDLGHGIHSLFLDFSPVVFSMQLSMDSETVHHSYISTCFAENIFVPCLLRSNERLVLQSQTLGLLLDVDYVIFGLN